MRVIEGVMEDADEKGVREGVMKRGRT